ncbi:MAG: hypothetical protein IJI88_02880 [Atopobiaceae bacterium]|nr:hypothetical protein [Atopobiaceae bacterium]
MVRWVYHLRIPGPPGILGGESHEQAGEFERGDRRRCVNALVTCILVVVCVFVGVVTKLTAPSTMDDLDEGLRSFRYYTVLSSMLVAT